MLKMGTSHAVVTCDWCGKEIRAGGLAECRVSDGAVYFAHDRCHAKLERDNGGSGAWNVLPLKQFLLDLLKGA
jgi:hypothetical protein